MTTAVLLALIAMAQTITIEILRRRGQSSALQCKACGAREFKLYRRHAHHDHTHV